MYVYTTLSSLTLMRPHLLGQLVAVLCKLLQQGLLDRSILAHCFLDITLYNIHIYIRSLVYKHNTEYSAVYTCMYICGSPLCLASSAVAPRAVGPAQT